MSDCKLRYIEPGLGAFHVFTCDICTRRLSSKRTNPSLIRRQCPDYPVSDDWRPPPGGIVDPGFGPGAELKALFASLGFEPTAKCPCDRYAAQMNVWGIDGCTRQHDTIIRWMRQAYDLTTWLERRTAEVNAVLTGLAFKLDWSDPIPSLVDEAISRADKLGLTLPF